MGINLPNQPNPHTVVARHIMALIISLGLEHEILDLWLQRKFGKAEVSK